MLWGVLWHSRNKQEGYREHLMYEDCLPVLRRTRREAREYINSKYGYIRERPDLRAEPHGWMIPRAVKVAVIEI